MRAPTVIHAGRIIVADDQPCHLGPVEAILAQAGYDVVSAVNGREVLDKAAVFAPDLFLLDVNMPELDGFETCSCLKDDPDFQDTPVIFMSAQDDIHAVECAFELGGSDFLSKPFNRAELLVRVRAHLRAYHARGRFRHQVLEEARQLGNVASLCVNLARTVTERARSAPSDASPELAVPEMAACLAGNAETLARDIERLLGRDDAGFLRQLHLRDFARETSASDVLAFLGGAYLRAKRRGVSLTMPRRPDEFHLPAAPGDIKKLLDGFSDHFLDHLPRGAACHVATACRNPGEICLRFTHHPPEGDEDGSEAIAAAAFGPAMPAALAELAARLGVEVEVCRGGQNNRLQMLIALPAGQPDPLHSASRPRGRGGI